MSSDKTGRIYKEMIPPPNDIYAEKHKKQLNDAISHSISCLTNDANALHSFEYRGEFIEAMLINLLTRTTINKMSRDMYFDYMGHIYDAIIQIKGYKGCADPPQPGVSCSPKSHETPDYKSRA